MSRVRDGMGVFNRSKMVGLQGIHKAIFFRDARDARDPRHARDTRHARHARHARDPRDVRESEAKPLVYTNLHTPHTPDRTPYFPQISTW